MLGFILGLNVSRGARCTPAPQCTQAPQCTPAPQCSPARGVIVACVAVLLLSCSSLPGLKSARRADFDALRTTLEREQLRPRQVRRLAQEVLSAEIVRAKDREDRSFIQGLRSCSGPLLGALERRAQKHDGVGAESALLLLEAGRLPSAKKYEREDDGAWRALSARATKGDGPLRRRYFSDDDERVRRAALLAALEASDEDDVPELLEVARLDPDPLTRNRAYQTLGAIGGEKVAAALKDRFTRADEELRLAIVDAWAQPGIYEDGGRRHLLRLMTHEHGFDALHAASVLSRDPGESVRNRGEARLLRFADEGTTQEKRLAIRMLSTGSEASREKLIELTRSTDPEVAVIAWARLLGSRSSRKQAHQALIMLAQQESSIGFQARSALAAAGDERILPLMEKQMKAKAPETRRVAGTALVRLGAYSTLAPLLADPDPGVRRDVACRTLSRAPLPVE